ncbi:MAG: hypothetical protein DMG07_06340 [Acidobacteria bacterium]|nr:MAG: hypothetical protein DMG07_06340 [Acidobacteriota bacterium]
MHLPQAWTFAPLCISLAGLLFAQACARRDVAQPIAFPHRVHAEKKIRCTFCHAGAERNSQATLPSVTLCMSCHSVVKADAPEIVKVKSYLDSKTEIPWRRIYRLDPEAEVFFNHHRHAAAAVPCATCHGDVASRDVLVREVNLEMGFCVRCHRAAQAKFRDARLASDCATCHR